MPFDYARIPTLGSAAPRSGVLLRPCHQDAGLSTFVFNHVINGFVDTWRDRSYVDQVKVVIDGAAASIAVADAENLHGLSVELRDATPEQASDLLGDWGWVDGEHVWLDIGTLKVHCPFPHIDGWEDQFDRAMAYADKSGWTDVTGAFVRAHIESVR
jgi:hypothetical protein